MAERAHISIVIAMAEGDSAIGLARVLESLRAQRGEFDEIVVVGADRVDDADDVRWVQTLEPLVPMRWARGIHSATGEIVLLTTSQMLPDERWVATAASALTDASVAAAGGPIDPPREGGAVAWACFFLRYSAYLNAPPGRFVDDLAADNAAYRREELLSQKKLDGGFWEPEFHRVMLAKGLKLSWVPEMRVRLQSGPPFGLFMRQRFEHGTRFGRNRVADAAPAVRAGRVLTSPLIPAIFFAKIARRVLSSGRHPARFVYSMPAMICLLLSWSIGETWGYVTPRRDRHARAVRNVGALT